MIKWVTRLVVSSMLAAGIVATASCDGGPSFGAAVDYKNKCDVAVRVSVSNTKVETLSVPKPSQAAEVKSGSHTLVTNEILLPAPLTVYLFVAEESEPEFKGPNPINVASLDSRVADDGTTVYTIEIPPAMCPAH